jgi:hypothetical protein
MEFSSITHYVHITGAVVTVSISRIREPAPPRSLRLTLDIER